MTEELERDLRAFWGELFGRYVNGYRIEDGRAVLEVGDEPDPEWLDVDRMMQELTVATADGDWELRIVAQPKRTVVAASLRPRTKYRASPRRRAAMARWSSLVASSWSAVSSTSASSPRPSPSVASASTRRASYPSCPATAARASRSAK